MRGRWERHRTTVLIGAGTLAALLVAVLLGTGNRTSASHDPDNPGGTGAQAVARVLADEGVDVEVARSAAELEDAEVDAGTTVLVTSPDNLGRSTARRLLAHAGAATVVVAGPGPGAVAALGIEVDGTTAVPDSPAGRGLHRRAASRCCRAWRWTWTAPPRGPPPPAASAVPTAGGSPRPTTACCCSAPRASWRTTRSCGPTTPPPPCACSAGTTALVWYVPDLADLSGDDGVSLRSLAAAVAAAGGVAAAA